MKFTAAVVLAAAAGAAAWENVTYTTEVVEVYETYCPGPTTITYGSSTITVTEPTTITITDCPCTITKPIITETSTYCPPTTTPVYTNSTMTQVPTTSTGGIIPTETPSPPPTGAAGKAVAVSGAGLAGIVGLAAFIL